MKYNGSVVKIKACSQWTDGIFQSFHLIRDLSVLENVKMGMVIANSKRKIREKISKKKMNQKVASASRKIFRDAFIR